MTHLPLMEVFVLNRIAYQPSNIINRPECSFPPANRWNVGLSMDYYGIGELQVITISSIFDLVFLQYRFTVLHQENR